MFRATSREFRIFATFPRMSPVCVAISSILRLFVPSLEDFLDIFRYEIAPIFNGRSAYGYLFMDYRLYHTQTMVSSFRLQLFDPA